MKRLLLISSLIAATLCGGLYAYDTKRAREFDSEQAAQLLRQLGSQVEALAISARERGERAPVAYAISFFSQGAEPRAFRLAQFRATQPDEAGFSRAEDGWYEYSRILDRDELTGIRLRLQPANSGFLGARTALANDLRAASLFTLVFLLLALGAKSRLDRHALLEAARLKSDARRWNDEARTVLAQLGTGIRETLETTQKLGASGEESEKALAMLKDRVYAGLNGVHQGRRALSEQEVVAAHAHLSSLKIEKALRAGDLALATTFARELQGQMQSLRQLAHVACGSFRDLELQLEPWALDADQASAGLDSVIELNAKLRERVRATTDGLKGQAQVFREIAEATK